MSEQKTALQIGTEAHQVLASKLSVTFDGGKSWEEVTAVNIEVFDMLKDFEVNSPLPKQDMRVFSSVTMSGSFTLKPKKPRKVRQTPPFWSAYR